MKINQVDQIVINESDFVDILYRGLSVNNIAVEDSAWIEHYNRMCALFELPEQVVWEQESTLSRDAYIDECLTDWNLPDEYQQLNIKEYALSKCRTQVQMDRVNLELKEFEDRNMIHVLRFLKYFVDTLTEHNMVWGVGRGSSVSSYVLYLLGVHKVDSLKYGLSLDEFLK